MSDQEAEGAKTPPKPSGPTNNILIGENGDILARYRIPIDNTEVDYALQLPSDADSSDMSS